MNAIKSKIIKLSDGRYCRIYDKQLLYDKLKIVLYICDEEGNHLKNEQGKDRMLVKNILEYTREILPTSTLIGYID